tara:strand:+ start:1001 stop:1345 length:345 start_codon:yes stop_codon:yes gene_type:complete
LEENERPWGRYDILFENDNCKVKKITVKPGGMLSYQYHTKRRETWTIIKGNLSIMLDGMTSFREAGQTIKIPLGTKHRAWNETDETIEFIEVQTGTYFGEDDIVRLDDKYGRED